MIRFARRLANWEDPALSVEELQAREFKARDGGPDLRPSVYAVDDVAGRLVQTYAEHAHRLDPPPTALALDVATVVPGTLVTTPGEAPFRFTREQHREVELRDHAQLLEFVRVARSVQRHEVRKGDVVAFVRGRLAVADAEWVAVASKGDAKPWLRRLIASR